MSFEPTEQVIFNDSTNFNQSDESVNFSKDQKSIKSNYTFPLARIKKIMKADKDVNLCSAESVFLTSFATVLFYLFIYHGA
jgi:hypothetical protein